MSGTPTIPDSPVTPESPWLGLHSFTEEARAYFFGRGAELEDLYERILDRPLAILFGQSGLGKSSLIQAALVPRLRASGFLPVVIRLDHETNAPPLEIQLLESLRPVLESAGYQAQAETLGTALADGTAGLDHSALLWLLFHDPAHGLIPRRDMPADGLPRVVLLIDQFEEIFTLGERAPRRGASAAFRETLAALVENRPPSSLRALLEADDNLAERIDYRARHARVLISLREDFLHLLERWRRAMPSLMENRLELRMLNGPQAFLAVVRPGQLRPGLPAIIPDPVGRAIVRFVAGASDDVPLDEIDAVPPLLSLVCAELNRQRLDSGSSQITQAHFQGQGTDILANFYVRSFDLATYASALDGLPGASAALKTLRRLIEDRLLSPDGFRESIAFDTMTRDLSQTADPDTSRAVLDGLVERRLLTVEERGGVRRIELAHDVLTRIVKASRDERQEVEGVERARSEQEGAEAETARILKERNRLQRVVTLALRQRNKAAKATAALKNALRQARQNAYIAHINLAQREWDNTYAAHARELLENPDESEFRGFEWHYLKRLYYPELLTLRGHTDPVYGMAFSPDGLRLASAGGDQAIRIWDAATGQELLTLKGHAGAAYGAAFSPDGLRLASASEDNTVRLWDAATGRELLTLKGHASSVNGVAFSPDGNRLASASRDNTVKLWDPSSGLELLTLKGHASYVDGVAFSPDGLRLASASWDGTVRVWLGDER